MKWSQCFEARFLVVGKRMTITLPLTHKININSIRPSISNWIEIEGIIDENQKISCIPYSRNGSPDCAYCDSTKEEERKKAKTEALT